MVSINDRLVELSRWMGDALQTVEGIIAAAITEVSNAVQPYPDRAEWVAKSIPATVVRTAFIVHGQTFPVIRDADGAFSQADGTKWSPDGPAMFGHWNITGVPANGPGSNDYYTAIPTADETVRIQQAMNWCLPRGRDLSCEPSRVYGITAQLIWGKNGTVEPTGTPKLKGNFVVIGGTWPRGDQSAADHQNFTFGRAALIIGNGVFGSSGQETNNQRGKYNTQADVYIDCNRIAPVGLWSRAFKKGHCQYYVVRDIEAQVRIGQNNDNEWNGNDASYGGYGCQFSYGEQSNGVFAPINTVANPNNNDISGYWGPIGRTSWGLVIDGSDITVMGATHHSSKTTLLFKSGWNVGIRFCAFWNGNSRTDPRSATMVYAKDTGQPIGSTDISHNRIEDGAIVLYSFDLMMAHNRQIQFTGNPSSVRLVASKANETAEALTFVDNFIGQDAALETDGIAGSWGTFRANVGGNRRGDRTPATIGGVLETIGRSARVSNTAMQVDVPLTGLAVQSSKRDAATGKAMLNGGHGVGAVDLTGAELVVADLRALNNPGGFYRTNDETLGTFPTIGGLTVGKSGMLQVHRYSDVSFRYEYTPVANSTLGGGVTFTQMHNGATMTFGPWVISYNSLNQPIQTSTTDATPGRLQLVGAFGSGATELPNAADPNAITVSGKYRVFGLTNTPTAGIFVLEHFQRFSGQATQTAYMLGSPQRLYKRDFFNSAWSTWRLFNETLGAVSQTGGSPTGAIIERGSNANGDFVRFADGTQIAISPEFTADVTSATGSIFRMSAAQGWTLPSAFVGPTSGSVSTIGSSSTHFGSLNIIGALSAEIMLFAPSSTTGRRFRAVVNGRWF